MVTTLNPTRRCFTRTWDAVLITHDDPVVRSLLHLFEADVAGRAPVLGRRFSRRVIVGPERARPSVAESWDAELETLPPGWSDLLCRLELDSSALLTRAALVCAPINPTRDRDHVGFTFRCARTAGYGVSPGMARRCFEQLDEEGIGGSVSVLRSLSGTDNVATQGAVWYVGGKVL